MKARVVNRMGRGWSSGIVTTFALALATHASASAIIYVDADASPGGDGMSWGTAFQFLQDALEIARLSDHIWVAEGTYYPPDGLDNPPPNLRDVSFELVNGVALHGGFVGGESQLGQRDPENNITTLSGDIGTPSDNSDNSFHVVTAENVGPRTELNGFTVRDGAGSNNAGGMLIQDANPQVVRCSFIGNSSGSAGGAIFMDGAQPPGTALVVNCCFFGNSTGNAGGGVFCQSSIAQFVNCVFSGNSALSHGGGIDVVFGLTTDVEIINCTFSGNSVDPANEGGAVAVNGATVDIENCILWGNSPDEIDDDGITRVFYSDIQGGWPGSGNIDKDPGFCDADGPDDIVGTVDDNLRLRDASPCVDTGRENFLPPDRADVDDDGNATEILPWDRDTRKRQFDAVPGLRKVDMGAYENQHITSCPWDIAGPGGGAPDGQVNINDLLLLLASWGSCPGCPADFNCDLVVDATDQLALLANWGACP